MKVKGKNERGKGMSEGGKGKNERENSTGGKWGRGTVQGDGREEEK